MPVDLIRLQQANAILATFSPGSRLEVDRGRLYFAWFDYRRQPQRKLWCPQSRGSDYPSARHLPFGGTCTQATMELYRWARGEPVRPLGMWRRFQKVGGPFATLEAAIAVDWPEQVPCVFCGRPLGNGVAYDHYDRDGFPVGPGCWYGEGCSGDPKRCSSESS